MPSIGDLANEFARALYEWRVPVAVVSIIAVVVAVAIASRLGWFAAARRHPARSTVVIGLVIVIVAPVGWYLGSPIFIRTSLVEAAPAGADAAVAPSPTFAAPSAAPSAAPATIAPSAPSATPTARPTPTIAPTLTAFVPTTLAEGTFEGTDDFHFGRGTAKLIETAPGRYHLRLEDFSVRNGPDLYVYLSTASDDYADDALEVGTLKATDGSFGYDLPDGVDPSRYRSAIIWCKQFSHLFATAPFEDG